MTKRVNLTMHEDYWNKLQMLADRDNISPSEKARGLIAKAWDASPFNHKAGDEFIVEQRGKDFSPAKFKEECSKPKKSRETLPERAHTKRHGKPLHLLEVKTKPQP